MSDAIAQPPVFDTHRYAQRLERAKMPPEQVTAQTEGLTEALAGVATRADLMAMEQRMTERMSSTVKSLENRMLLYMGGLAAFLFAAMGAGFGWF